MPAGLVKGAIATVAVTSVAAGGVATVEVTRDRGARPERARRAERTRGSEDPAKPPPPERRPGNAPRVERTQRALPQLQDRRNGQAVRPSRSCRRSASTREAAARRQNGEAQAGDSVEGRRPDRRDGAADPPGTQSSPSGTSTRCRPEKPLPPRKQATPLPEAPTELPLPQVP